MSELIKYANTDVLDGLKYIRAGLNNIIAHVVNTKKDYVISIPIKFTTLRDLLELAILKNYYVLDYYLEFGENFFVIVCDKFKVEIAKIESGYRFRLLK